MIWPAILVLSLFDSGPSTSSPTYREDVAPIIQQQCAPCHQPGGGGPFPLLTFSDVRRHASQIASVTRRRIMPPWLPDAPPGTFSDERRLTSAQIQTISDWVDHSSPEGNGVISVLPAAAATDGWHLGTPDLILTPNQPFRLPASGPDSFWNFVLRPSLDRPRFVRAIEIQPGDARLVHHANLLVDRTGECSRLEMTPGSGFGGMDLNLSRNPLDPESHFLFWKPGSQPYLERPGFSWQLSPGNLLLLNTHLQSSGKTEEVLPRVGIYFTDQPPARFPILVELQNDRALHIPAGARDFVVQDSLVLPENVSVLAIYPHAHYLGTEMEGTAVLPDGTHRSLIHIAHWDPAQQAVYRFCEPVRLPKGTRISMRFHYNNSAANVRNPNTPPRAVHAGNNATDEMGHLWLQLLPEGRGDHRRSIEEAVFRRGIEREPLDPTPHVNLAAVLLSRLDTQGALSELQQAVRIDSTRPETHDMLGVALENTGQLQPAIAEFRRALQLDDRSMSAHYDLAAALIKAGKADEALPHMQLVADAYPKSARLQNELANLKSRLGEKTAP